MNKLVTVLALCGLSTLSLPVLAEDGPHSITGNLAFVSDYAFRGISQTDEDPAIQGGFDYAHASGFYLGVWGSNVEFGAANMELDVYGGYAGAAGDLGYNVGILQYLYPDYDDANTLEVYGGITYKGFGLKASYTVSDDYFDVGNGDGTVYWDAAYNYAFENGLGVGLHYGHTSGQGGQIDYADWKVGVTYPVGKFTIGLAYTDTDISGCAACDERLILSVATTF